MVGWVSLGPREDYARLTTSKVLAPVDDTPVWSHRLLRRVARASAARASPPLLLDAAVDYARDHGATMLEAYPVDTAGERIAAANAYHGTLRMFERAGFTVAERRQWNKTSPVRPIVRRGLTGYEQAVALIASCQRRWTCQPLLIGSLIKIGSLIESPLRLLPSNLRRYRSKAEPPAMVGAYIEGV